MSGAPAKPTRAKTSEGSRHRPDAGGSTATGMPFCLPVFLPGSKSADCKRRHPDPVPWTDLQPFRERCPPDGNRERSFGCAQDDRIFDARADALQRHSARCARSGIGPIPATGRAARPSRPRSFLQSKYASATDRRSESAGYLLGSLARGLRRSFRHRADAGYFRRFLFSPAFAAGSGRHLVSTRHPRSSSDGIPGEPFSLIVRRPDVDGYLNLPYGPAGGRSVADGLFAGAGRAVEPGSPTSGGAESTGGAVTSTEGVVWRRSP